MYGWRGRIGAILGRPNAVCEPEFNKMVPEGVSVHGARMTGHAIARYNDPKVMKDMDGYAGDCAEAMKEFRPDVVVFTHNAASMATVAFNKKITKTMEKRAGCPALTTATALVEGETIGVGTGGSKKSAAIDAAREALEAIQGPADT